MDLSAGTKNSASQRQESFPTVDEVFERLKVTQMNGGVPSASDTAILLDYCIMLERKLDKEREESQKKLKDAEDTAGEQIIAIKTTFHQLRRDWITREIQFKDQVKKLEIKLCEESLQGMGAVYETRRYSLLDTSKTFQRSVQELLEMKDGIGYASRNDLGTTHLPTPSPQSEASPPVSNPPLHGLAGDDHEAGDDHDGGHDVRWPQPHLSGGVTDHACEPCQHTRMANRGSKVTFINDVEEEETGNGLDEHNGHVVAKDQPSSDEDTQHGGDSGGCDLSVADDDDASVHDSQRPATGADDQTSPLHQPAAQRPGAARSRDGSATRGGSAYPHLQLLHLSDIPGPHNDDGAALVDTSPYLGAVGRRFSFLPGDDFLPGSVNTQATVEQLPGLAGLAVFDSLVAHVDEKLKANTALASVKAKAADGGDFDPLKVDFFKDTAGWSWSNDEDDAKSQRCDFDRLQKKHEDERLAFRLAVPKDPVTGQYIFRPSLPRNEPLGVLAEREAEALSNTSRMPATSSQMAWPPVRRQQIDAAQRDAPRAATQRSRKALFGNRAETRPAWEHKAQQTR